MRLLLSLCTLIYAIDILQAQEELGKVTWLRDIELAKSRSQQESKPILILFQEIPGCSTCKNYGNHVLKHPHLVEAIEDHFIPLAIYNNRQGKDKEVLNYFNEPSWNNPVVRIVDFKLNDLTNRLSSNYSLYGLVSTINGVLRKKNIVIPKYLQLLEEESLAQTSGIQTAYVGMYCFWSGEKCFGNEPGVVATRAGFMGGSEVLEIKYNSKSTELQKIIAHGKTQNCADRYFSDVNNQDVNIPVKPLSAFRPDKESKYYIFQSDYKFLPMTELQATKVNLSIAIGKSPDEFLSPRQLKFLQKIKTNKEFRSINCIGQPYEKIWYELN